MDARWQPELLKHLRATTRELNFDWVAVSQDVRKRAEELLGPEGLRNIDLSPGACRHQFAADYSTAGEAEPAQTVHDIMAAATES
eukprot:CAMPEP_0173204550 /NCGR_PEP_ID=MMETSP1141-20130122/20184_1 /TAXON_ID=483371 /ORGANISM="non described non described, Strain CCMP2298" /LENGTH=84 /DNA_ID=CAMNT_0014130225 /DNA_START=1 /DNA_END=252 /DNA_ORIENTATION=+